MQSTTGRYIPGVGRTITQANIRWLLAKGIIGPDADPERVADECCGKFPVEPRHVARARRLMYGTSPGTRAAA
jgi:hypothetical protein